MENKEQNFINRYKDVQESIVKAMDKALERAIGNKVIDFEKCEGNYLDVYPLIGAVLQKELDRVLGGSVSKDIHRKTKKDARKYAVVAYGAMVDLIKRTGRLDLDMDSGTHVDDFPAEIRIFTDNGLICLSITSVYLSGEDNLMVDGYDDDNDKVDGVDVYYDQISEVVYLAKVILEEMEEKDHGESS